MIERKFSISDALYCWVKFICWNLFYGFCFGIPILLMFISFSTTGPLFVILPLIASICSYFLALKKTLTYQYKHFSFKKSFEKIPTKDVILAITLYLGLTLLFHKISNPINIFDGTFIGISKIFISSFLTTLVSLWVFIRIKTTVTSE